ncbi:hypothetical protein [Pelagicoccus mobilis]
MIKALFSWREKRRVLKGVALIRAELWKKYPKKRYFPESQIIDTGVALGLKTETIEYAVSFLVVPKRVDGVLIRMGASKTTKEIATNIGIWYGGASLVPEGYQGSLSDAISDFYKEYISPGLDPAKINDASSSSEDYGNYDSGYSDFGGGDSD